MLGQLVFDGGRGGPRRALLYGLPVLRCHTDPEGFWGERRLKRAGRSLYSGGVVRALVPPGFDRWPLLLALGLRPMDPGPFLRAHAAPLTASLLERQGLAPDRATVALRGQRADGAMLRAALALCPRVRRLTISAPRGGERLAAWLRRDMEENKPSKAKGRIFRILILTGVVCIVVLTIFATIYVSSLKMENAE